jgi:predicted RNA-binding Zn ribbon-like protein
VTSPPVVPRQPLAVDFMNTIWADRDGVHDTLADLAGLATWLASSDAPAVPGLDDFALGRFQALRDALRLLAAEVTGDTRAVAGPPGRDVAEAIRTLNLSCSAAPSWSQLDWPRSGDLRRRVVTGAGPADAALARLAEAAAGLFGSGLAAQLGACLAPGCVLYFLRDRARRQWCSDGCGNRARVARHYARHHAPPGSSGPAGGGPPVG